MAVIAWTSLFDGNVRIDTGVADLDPTCGDGVRFFVDKGTKQLSALTLTNANAVMVQPAITTAVTFGESLYFIVDAGRRATPAGHDASGGQHPAPDPGLNHPVGAGRAERR